MKPSKPLTPLLVARAELEEEKSPALEAWRVGSSALLDAYNARMCAAIAMYEAAVISAAKQEEVQ